MNKTHTAIAFAALAIFATDAQARGSSGGGSHSSGSHSSGVRLVHSYVRPTSAQTRVHTPKLAPLSAHNATHKAHTSIPYVAPHFAPAPAINARAALAGLGALQSVSRSASVSSTGAASQSVTFKGTNETVKLTRSVSKTGVVTFKATVSAPASTTSTKAATTATPKASTSSAHASKAPHDAKPDKAASAPAAKPGKAGKPGLDGPTTLVNSPRIRCANGAWYNYDLPEHCKKD
jgi:hypothetical protein